MSFCIAQLLILYDSSALAVSLFTGCVNSIKKPSEKVFFDVAKILEENDKSDEGENIFSEDSMSED